MKDVVSEAYDTKEKCFREILVSRRIMGDKNLFTLEVAEAMLKGLGLMYLHCPDEIKETVHAFMNEVMIRKTFIETGIIV